ncbi:hypothetical protein XACM_2509 [Xanthomonas euvesicatoria pv. citrumelo F1]|nr:hypothetical protein XACM_2509 [Xanthomonas euvesicatoria pv. citrumelo F1]
MTINYSRQGKPTDNHFIESFMTASMRVSTHIGSSH